MDRDEREAEPVDYWHGGGRIDGAVVLPSKLTGRSRSDDHGVFVTTSRSLAETYASTVPGKTAWVYQVEPVGPVVPVPSAIPGAPTISYRCSSARIVARFTVPNQRREQYQRAVAAAAGALAPER